MNREKIIAVFENASPQSLIWAACFVVRLAAGQTMRKTAADAQEATNTILTVLAANAYEAEGSGKT